MHHELANPLFTINAFFAGIFMEAMLKLMSVTKIR
jgi:hypothetical protein